VGFYCQPKATRAEVGLALWEGGTVCWWGGGVKYSWNCFKNIIPADVHLKHKIRNAD
jgi:hypothetical protein